MEYYDGIYYFKRRQFYFPWNNHRKSSAKYEWKSYDKSVIGYVQVKRTVDTYSLIYAIEKELVQVTKWNLSTGKNNKIVLVCISRVPSATTVASSPLFDFIAVFDRLFWRFEFAHPKKYTFWRVKGVNSTTITTDQMWLRWIKRKYLVGWMFNIKKFTFQLKPYFVNCKAVSSTGKKNKASSKQHSTRKIC